MVVSKSSHDWSCSNESSQNARSTIIADGPCPWTPSPTVRNLTETEQIQQPSESACRRPLQSVVPVSSQMQFSNPSIPRPRQPDAGWLAGGLTGWLASWSSSSSSSRSSSSNSCRSSDTTLTGSVQVVEKQLKQKNYINLLPRPSQSNMKEIDWWQSFAGASGKKDTLTCCPSVFSPAICSKDNL